jgi:hypothetical protein
MIYGKRYKLPSWDGIWPYIIDALDIPSSDVRDCRSVYDWDYVEVRLWNHRRILISGMEFVNWDDKT